MKKRFMIFWGLCLACLSLSSCGNTTIIYEPAKEADIAKIENDITTVYDTVSKGCVGIYCNNGGNSISTGSGVIYKKNNGLYYVVTNAHVVEKSTSVRVYLGEGLYYKAQVIGYDTKNDIAVVTFSNDLFGKEQSGELYINDIFNYEKEDIVSVGQTVLAIGCPLSLDNYNVLATGVVSSVDKLQISHNADINPGNSGGGLFNLAGRLIGLNYEGQVWTTSDGERIPVQGRFFAIPLKTIKRCITAIEAKNGNIEHPVIGIQSTEINSLIENEAYETYKDFLPDDNYFTHVIIVDVVSDSVAMKAGLKNKDVIIKVDDNDIIRIKDLTSYLTFIQAGDSYEFTVYRSSEKKIVKIQINI